MTNKSPGLAIWIQDCKNKYWKRYQKFSSFWMPYLSSKDEEEALHKESGINGDSTSLSWTRIYLHPLLQLRKRSAAKTEARPTGRSHSKSYLILTLTSLEVYRVSRTLRSVKWARHKEGNTAHRDSCRQSARWWPAGAGLEEKGVPV